MIRKIFDTESNSTLADLSDFKHFDRSFAQTKRLRTERTDILLAAARDAGVHRIVARSYANFRYAREGGPVKTEAFLTRIPTQEMT